MAAHQSMSGATFELLGHGPTIANAVVSLVNCTVPAISLSLGCEAKRIG